MKYNRPQATASWGSMAKDWEKGVDYDRLHKERLARAQEAIRHAGLGGVIAFNFDNIRYITGTHIGEWARDKFMRYALCPVQGPPFLWDPAPPAKRISSPWIADNVAAPISTMQGGLPPQMNVQGVFHTAPADSPTAISAAACRRNGLGRRCPQMAQNAFRSIHSAVQTKWKSAVRKMAEGTELSERGRPRLQSPGERCMRQ